MNLVIRKVRLDDLPSIDKVNESAYGHPGNPYCLRQYFDLFHESYLVAESDGSVVGFCIGGIKPHSADGWILDLAVLTEKQGRGIGRKLLEETCEILRSLGVRNLYLTVDPSNIRTLGLYERFNFVAQGEEKSYFGDNRDRLIMRFDL